MQNMLTVIFNPKGVSIIHPHTELRMLGINVELVVHNIFPFEINKISSSKVTAEAVPNTNFINSTFKVFNIEHYIIFKDMSSYLLFIVLINFILCIESYEFN